MILNIPQEIYISLDDKNFFNDLMHVQGELYRDQIGRKTSRVKLAGQDYFIKQHFGVGYVEILKNLCRLRLPVIGAKNEWQALEKCQILGIKTAPLVGYGATGCNPASQKSFVITRPLEHMQNLEQVFQKPMTFAAKRNIIYQLAQMVSLFHQAGMCHKDMYLCHFLLDGQRQQLYMMDLHRVTIHEKLSRRDEIKDLAALLYSSFDFGFSKRDYLYFFKIYKNKPLADIIHDPLIKLIFNKAHWIYQKDYGYEPEDPIFSSIKLADGSSIQVKAMLRQIPKRRWVVKATWQDKPVVVKIFASEKKYQQELAGVARCNAAGIAIPQVLYQGQVSQKKIFLIIYEYIEKKSKNNTDLIEDLVKTIAEHHNKDLMQKDVHVNNFIKADNKIITLDAGDVVKLKHPFDNLALLLAQFWSLDSKKIQDYLKKYCQERHVNYPQKSTDGFIKKVHDFKNKRKNIKIKKLFRTCSAITCWRGFNYRILVRNDVRSKGLCFFLRHIDENQNLTDYTIERYTSCNLFKESEAVLRWRATHVDEFMEKPTVIPVAVVEKIGFFKKTSYFISRR